MPSSKDSIPLPQTGDVGLVTREHYLKIARFVNWMQKLQAVPPLKLDTTNAGPVLSLLDQPDNQFWSRIIGHAYVDASFPDGPWKYSWEEVRRTLTGWRTVEDGRTGDGTTGWAILPSEYLSSVGSEDDTSGYFPSPPLPTNSYVRMVQEIGADGVTCFTIIGAPPLGVQNIRYNTDTHKLQETYNQNPQSDADWDDAVTFVPCGGS